jgi:hypothetical protein
LSINLLRRRGQVEHHVPGAAGSGGGPRAGTFALAYPAVRKSPKCSTADNAGGDTRSA